MTLFGMGTVFLLLILLMGVLYLIGLTDKAKPAPKVAAAPAAAAVAAASTSVLSDDELVALTLALEEAEAPKRQPRLAIYGPRSSPWANTGRTVLHNHAQRV